MVRTGILAGAPALIRTGDFMLSNLQNIDIQLFLSINRSFSNHVLDQFFMVATEPVYYILPGILVALYFLKANWKKTVMVVTLATITVVLTETLCDDFLKPFFARPRPCNPDMMVTGARCIAGLKTSFSFPSAHAMNIFAQATLFTFLFPAKSVFFFLFAIVIGISRIYLGVHYPSDVASGALMGSAVAAIVYATYIMIRKRYSFAAI